MIKRIAALLFFPGFLYANSCTSTGSGFWDVSGTWSSCGGSVPGSGDTANINNGHTVTVRDSRIVGTSPSDSTVVLFFQSSGELVIASGGTLTVKGSGQYVGGFGANTGTYLDVQGGGMFKFDATGATYSTTTYQIGGDNGGSWRPVVLEPGSTFTSNPAGGHGFFSFQYQNGAYNFNGSSISYIGDGSNVGFPLYWGTFDGDGAFWNVTNSTFTNCGLIQTFDDINSSDTFIHSGNLHVNSLGGSVISLFGSGSSQGTFTQGTRQINNNVFDINAGQMTLPFFTMNGNYFGNNAAPYHSEINYWNSFQNNFYRATTSNPDMNAAGDVVDNIFFKDDPVTNNPHIIIMPQSKGATIKGSIFEHTGFPITDSGEWSLVGVGLASNTTYYTVYNLLLPNAAGTGSTEIQSVQQCVNGCTNTFFETNHNTFFARSYPSPNNEDALHTQEQSGGNPTGILTSYQANLLYNPQANSEVYKLAATNVVATVDPCAPANCDYNNAWNLMTDSGGFSTGGNGYADHFSSIPGQHDLAANPNYVDSSRNVPTFDSAYLGNTYSPWSSTATYSYGGIVSSSSNTVYSGATINYRYVNASGCSGANPQPGIFTSTARACWEWETLNDLRIQTNAQTLYNDLSIGAFYDPINVVLLKWIRAGWSPTNMLLSGASTPDSTDIGALNVLIPAPTQIQTIVNSQSAIFSGNIKIKGKVSIL